MSARASWATRWGEATQLLEVAAQRRDAARMFFNRGGAPFTPA